MTELRNKYCCCSELGACHIPGILIRPATGECFWLCYGCCCCCVLLSGVVVAAPSRPPRLLHTTCALLLYSCCCLLCVFPIPFIIFALLFSLPPSRSLDPGSRSRLFSPLPITVRALHCYREKISALSPLVDSSRIAPPSGRFFLSLLRAERCTYSRSSYKPAIFFVDSVFSADVSLETLRGSVAVWRMR